MTGPTPPIKLDTHDISLAVEFGFDPNLPSEPWPEDWPHYYLDDDEEVSQDAVEQQGSATERPETVIKIKPPAADPQQGELVPEAGAHPSEGGKVIDFAKLRQEAYMKHARLDLAKWDGRSEGWIAYTLLGIGFMEFVQNLPKDSLLRRQIEEPVYERGKAIADQIDKLGK